MSTSNERTCNHKNAGFCAVCTLCKSCHHDDCMGEHSTARGGAGKLIRDKRIEYWKANSANEASIKQSRQATQAIGTFNEDELQKPVAESIALLEEAQQEFLQFPCYDYPVSSLAERLGIEPVNKRILNRASVFTSESLSNPTVSRDAAVLVDLMVDRCLCLICDSEDALTAMQGLYTERKHPSAGCFLRRNAARLY